MQSPVPHRQRRRDERGFTLIEILVVSLILAILAAMALPTFLSQRAKSQDAEAKLAAVTAQTAFETHHTDEEADAADLDDLRRIESSLVQGVSASGLEVDGEEDSYRLSVRSVSGNSFAIERDAGGDISRSCTTGGEGSCPQDERW